MRAPDGWQRIQSLHIEADDLDIEVHGREVFLTPSGTYFIPLESITSLTVRIKREVKGASPLTVNNRAAKPDITHMDETIWMFPANDIVGPVTEDGTCGELAVQYGKAESQKVTVLIGSFLWFGRFGHTLDQVGRRS